jgi:hypothetical protein
MKDLLKQAIADAKAVRETALANAKLALEEAFTPRLQSMLSAKLAEEMEGEEEEMTEEEETHDTAAEAAPVEDEAPVEEGDEMEGDETMEEGDEMPEEEMEEGEDMEAEESDDLDLDEIIKELEGEEEPAMEEGDDMESEEAPVEEGEDEEVNIEEIVRALREEDEEEMNEEEHEEEAVEENEEKEAELEEAYNVIRFLKGKINEVNLLNAKLLYSNKLFRNFSLNESQKMKVIENFDRAHNLREVKLVFSTLAESFKHNSGTKKIVKESFASKPIASTKPAKQVLSEGHELAERFKKLAGLNKRK